MAFVYILQSGKNERYYVGSTNNLERRLLEHNFGKTVSLRKLLPVKLVFKKEFGNIRNARLMERKLKRFKNRSILKRIIKDGEIKMGL